MHVALLLVGVFCALVSGAPVASSAPRGIQLTESNFTATSTNAWFVEFFSPKCRVCQRFEPIWEDLEREMASHRTEFPSAPFMLARVNCETWMDLCTRQNISGYPTFQLCVAAC